MSPEPTAALPENRLRFLLELGDRLRAADTPDAVTAVAAEMLGRELGVGRAGYGHVDETGETVSVENDWTDGGMASLRGEARILDAFGPAVIADLRAGRTLCVLDCQTDPRTNDPAFLPTWESIGTRALIVVPLLRSDRLVGILYVHSAHPRSWTAAEQALTEDVGARTWSAYSQSRTEEALRRSEERLRDITDALPIMIAYLDTEQRVRFANKAFEPWFDRPLEQIVGSRLPDLMDPEMYAARLPYVERALSGELLRYDIDRPRGGTLVHTEVLHVPHRDEKGRVAGSYVLVQDITARKQAEATIQQSERKFRQFADQNPAMIWSADMSGRLTYLSQRWYEYTGWPVEEPIRPSWDDVVHPDDRRMMHDRWAEAIAAQSTYDVEVRLLGAEARYRWHSIRAEPLRDEGGAITGWLGTNSDIQAAVEAREERQRSLDRLWQLSQELMLVRDAAGTIHAVNPSSSRILGWDPEEMLGKSVYDFIHPDDIAATRANVSAQMQASATIVIQNRYRAKNGSYRLLDWRGVPHQGFIHAVGRDITAERQAEEELRRTESALRQAQKMEAIGQLTGGIAHDFNNMLAGIIGGLDILKRRIAAGKLDDTARFLDAAMTSAHRAAALTQRLLAFGRRQSLDIHPVDARALLVSLQDLLQRTIGPGVTLTLELAEDLWPARADPSQLESAILNLAINGRDAMPEGGVLTIAAINSMVDSAADKPGAEPNAGEHVMITVTDTGTGMPQEVIERAFEPFFTTKPLGQGTGLGLSMIYGFMNQIGGRAQIRSSLGKGSSISLWLPRATGEKPEAQGKITSEAAKGTGETVLVVEDDVAVRMMVSTVLHELGYVVLEAGSAETALPLIRGRERIDLMVSDVGLPGINGRQIAEIARETRPQLKVLFITGYAEGAAVRSGFLGPGMQMITKPFDIDQLALRIRDMIGEPPDAS